LEHQLRGSNEKGSVNLRYRLIGLGMWKATTGAEERWRNVTSHYVYVTSHYGFTGRGKIVD